MWCCGGDGAHCFRCTPSKACVLGSSEAPGYRKCLVLFFPPTLSQNVEPVSQENPFLRRESLCIVETKSIFISKIMKEQRRLALGTPFPGVCSQVPPPETRGKKSNDSAGAGRASPRLCRVPPSQKQSWKPLRKKLPEDFGGEGRVPRLQMMSQVEAGVPRARTRTAVQSPLPHASRASPRSPFNPFSHPMPRGGPDGCRTDTGIRAGTCK